MKHSAEALSLPVVSRETSERLECLLAEIQRWSRTINLVGNRDLQHLRTRHLHDSMQIVGLLPATGVLIDIGSGAGFPGLVVAICTERLVHLVEADQRKAAFLREAGRLCGASVRVHAARVEAVSLPQASCVTSRGLASLRRLLHWTAPLLEPRGKAVFHKGATVARELTAAEREWDMQVCRWPSLTRADGVILEIGRISRRADQPP